MVLQVLTLMVRSRPTTLNLVIGPTNRPASPHNNELPIPLRHIHSHRSPDTRPPPLRIQTVLRWAPRRPPPSPTFPILRHSSQRWDHSPPGQQLNDEGVAELGEDSVCKRDGCGVEDGLGARRYGEDDIADPGKFQGLEDLG